jgi:hypothetical protein
MKIPKFDFLYNIIDEKNNMIYFGEVVGSDEKNLSFTVKLTSEPGKPLMEIPIYCYNEKTEEIVIK